MLKNYRQITVVRISLPAFSCGAGLFLLCASVFLLTPPASATTPTYRSTIAADTSEADEWELLLIAYIDWLLRRMSEPFPGEDAQGQAHMQAFIDAYAAHGTPSWWDAETASSANERLVTLEYMVHDCPIYLDPQVVQEFLTAVNGMQADIAAMLN